MTDHSLNARRQEPALQNLDDDEQPERQDRLVGLRGQDHRQRNEEGDPGSDDRHDLADECDYPQRQPDPNADQVVAEPGDDADDDRLDDDATRVEPITRLKM